MTDHIPVMLNEIIRFFSPTKEDYFVDCTFGSGGHSIELLTKGANVLAIDRDENNFKYAEKLKLNFGNKLIFEHDKFSNAINIIKKNKIEKISGILFDLGVSSMQLDEIKRGFSFQGNAALDMRMGLCDHSAFEIINNYTEKKLADIIYQFGDERFSRKIANAIVMQRKISPILNTAQLVDIIKKIVHINPKYKIHPATRTFQALRIETNNELLEVQSIEDIIINLPIGTKIAVLTFHSLEDRIVKNIFKKLSGNVQNLNRHDVKIWNTIDKNSILKIENNKPLIAKDEELLHNPRSRSAKLRLATRI